MMGRSHAALGALASAATSQALGNRPAQVAVHALVGTLAGLAPDLDHPGATLGRLLPRAWHALTPGHRGVTHSPPWCAGLALAVAIVALIFGLAWAWQAGLVTLAGTMSHLVADGITTQGCPWLYPWSRRCLPLPAALAIRTGGLAERLLVTTLSAVGLLTLTGQWALVGELAAILRGWGR